MLSRHRFKNQPGVVPLLFGQADDGKWPRRLDYGRYVHDVLTVNHGLALVNTSVHVAEQVDRLDLGYTDFKKLPDPIRFSVVLDDGSRHEMVVDLRGPNTHPLCCFGVFEESGWSIAFGARGPLSCSR